MNNKLYEKQKLCMFTCYAMTSKPRTVLSVQEKLNEHLWNEEMNCPGLKERKKYNWHFFSIRSRLSLFVYDKAVGIILLSHYSRSDTLLNNFIRVLSRMVMCAWSLSRV